MGKRKIIIAPSILGANFLKLGEELDAVNSSGAEMVHLDIMDGHFVPNISFGPDISEFIKKKTRLPCDAHLMVADPLFWAERFAKIGCEYITFHDETAEPIATARVIRKLGAKVGIAYNPDNKLKSLEKVLPEVSLVLLMTVFPGYCGQEFLEEGRRNIERASQLRDKINPGVLIVVDGGINLKTAPLAIKAGADILVAGSAFFKSGDYRKFVQELKRK